MRYSRLFGKTLRDKPRNADSASHQLLLRAGFVRLTSSGFLLLPLGRRVLDRIESILAEELQAAGAAALGFPGGQSANSDLSRSLRLERRDRGSDYPFADHHEASLAALAGSLGLSYRDLPLQLAGQRWAVRAAAHPNWGLLSAPEFLFHSAYGFASTDTEIAAHLEIAAAAYQRTFERAGLSAVLLPSAADPATTDIAVETDLPAAPILACGHCGYRASADIAASRLPEWPQQAEPGVVEAVYGPGLIQVEPLAKFLGIPVHQTTKTLLFDADGRTVAACVAGIYGVSETKLARVLGCRRLTLAAPETVQELTQAGVGYAGPRGLPESVRVVWDRSTAHRTNFEAGANRTDHHLINLHFGRDLPRPDTFFDIRLSLAGERCAQCEEGTLVVKPVIAIGHVTKIGTLYSELLGARFLDSDKTTHPISAGCAGLDLSAILAAVVEQNRDSRGIVWPRSMAPFAAHLISLPPAESAAEALYRQLRDAGVEVLWDDRPESAGVKFGDADLIGIPVRLVLSKRTGGQVEWKDRAAEQGELLMPEQVLQRLIAR